MSNLVAPFPWFGGKRTIAAEVWKNFGEVRNYVEPFFGSGAVLLARDIACVVETVNDADGLLVNFWRAVRSEPDAVAVAADWPVSEIDLLARHIWLVGQRESLTARLEADPDWYDVKAAGWWCWGACAWIGSGWCSGDGPWQVDTDGCVSVGDRGRGVNRQLPHLGTRGQGVNRQLPHLGNRGRGVNRQLPHLGNRGQGVAEWFSRLSDRLRDVRICCGDWTRVLGDSVTWRHGVTGVFLDPPYDAGAVAYSAGDSGIAGDVRAWALANGNDQRLRVALCGYREHDDLAAAGWRMFRWKARGGFASQGDGSNQNAAEETIWFSPTCGDAALPLFARIS
jgi:hypothetical protein